jgi:arylsulfatase A
MTKLIGLLLLFGLLPLPASAETPNVVVIFADDLGYRDLSCYGNPKIRTPNLDRLAAEGSRFTDFYVPQAVCSASRSALLTGCYPNRIGILGALSPTSKNGIHENETTLAELLKAKGYATAIYGKWHLGHHAKFLPKKHGFDDYYGLPYSNDMWPKHPTSKFPDLPLIDGDKTVATNPDQSKLTTAYTERGIQFIEQNKDKPFFLYMPHSMPHVPIFVSETRKNASKAGLYGDVIEELDWSVGQILDTLTRLKLDRKTLVIFTSDNGPWLSYGNHAGTATGFREGKGTTFEGGVRVPCIARLPGLIPPGTVCKAPAMTIDLLPTIAKLCEAGLPKTTIDGKEITHLLRNPTFGVSTQQAYFFYWGKELQAVRFGKWKLHFPHNYAKLTATGNDGQPGKYTPTKLELSLFDLEADPAETKNLAAGQKEIVLTIEGIADRMRRDLGDSLQKMEGTGTRKPGMVE